MVLGRDGVGGDTRIYEYRHITRLGAREESAPFMKVKIVFDISRNQGRLVHISECLRDYLESAERWVRSYHIV